MSPRFKLFCAVVFIRPLVSATGYCNDDGNDNGDEASLVQIQKTVAFGSERPRRELVSQTDMSESVGSGQQSSNQYAYLGMPKRSIAGVMAESPTSFTGSSAEQEQFMQMEYDKHAGEQAYLAQQKQAAADYFAQEQASAKAMVDKFNKQKFADLAASQAAQEVALHQAQQQEEMRNAKAVAQWQKKEGENAKLLGLGPMLSMTVRMPSMASRAAPQMTRQMPTVEYGDDAELVGLGAKPTMTESMLTMQMPNMA